MRIYRRTFVLTIFTATCLLPALCHFWPIVFGPHVGPLYCLSSSELPPEHQTIFITINVDKANRRLRVNVGVWVTDEIGVAAELDLCSEGDIDICLSMSK